MVVTLDSDAPEKSGTVVGEMPVPLDKILVTFSWNAVALVVNVAFNLVMIAAETLIVP